MLSVGEETRAVYLGCCCTSVGWHCPDEASAPLWRQRTTELRLIGTLWFLLPIQTSMTILVQGPTRLFSLYSTPLIFCSPNLAERRNSNRQNKMNATQWIFIGCLLFARRDEIFSKILEKAISLHKKMHKQLHSLRQTHNLRVFSLHADTETYGRKSHLLLQAVTIIGNIYYRKSANRISTWGPEIIYQRLGPEAHFTSSIQML